VNKSQPIGLDGDIEPLKIIADGKQTKYCSSFSGPAFSRQNFVLMKLIFFVLS